MLVEQGYEVVGVYMKNWSKDLPGFPCPWKEDYQDAKRVAVQLGIEFRMFDFEKEYFEKVVDYMLDGFRSGITPNPDIMCNQEIKFKLFLDVALEQGADMIATGHYAKVITKIQTKTDTNSEITKSSDTRVKPLTDGENVILNLLGVAKDDNKDQTYFLYRVTEAALGKTLFPLGNYTKPEVRELAKKFGLVTAAKKKVWVFVLSVKLVLRNSCSNMLRPHLVQLSTIRVKLLVNMTVRYSTQLGSVTV